MSELTFSMSGNWPCLTVIATHSLPFVDIDKTPQLLDTLTEKDAVYRKILQKPCTKMTRTEQEDIRNLKYCLHRLEEKKYPSTLHLALIQRKKDT